ncbi:MAG: VanZ family protein [Clostridia bacterium]|jgi:glycopeptide antibiotics resistance protein|nr:VanZ family protein [Clostridia bacterium]MDD4571607.1 VanZ family protein [Clostridia bacterium]
MRYYSDLLGEVPLGLLFFIACCLIIGYFIYSKKKGSNKSIVYDIVFVLMLLYSLAIIFYSIFPITVHSPGLEISQILSYNFKPFSDIMNYIGKNDFGYLAFNLAVLLLLPILLNLLRVKKLNWGKLVLVCFLVACGIELLQVFVNLLSHFRNHIVDIDSIILRTLGGAIGAAIASCKFMNLEHLHKE